MRFKFTALLAVVVAASVFFEFGRGYWYPYYLKMKGKRTVSEVIAEIGSSNTLSLEEMFDSSGANYPPKEIAFLAIKNTKKLEIWSRDNSDWVFVKELEILGTSGVLGPKLREGDRQVPEGKYQIEGLNPNSSYHLSMKLNYPNEFDLKWAAKEGRSEPGTNIFIHGKSGSIGCLAMGDEVIEQLFVLVEKVGRGNTSVIISPSDPRSGKLVPPAGAARWVNELYREIENEFLYISKT